MNEMAEWENLSGGGFGRVRGEAGSIREPTEELKKVIPETLLVEEGRISVMISSPRECCSMLWRSDELG